MQQLRLQYSEELRVTSRIENNQQPPQTHNLSTTMQTMARTQQQTLMQFNYTGFKLGKTFARPSNIILNATSKVHSLIETF